MGKKEHEKFYFSPFRSLSTPALLPLKKEYGEQGAYKVEGTFSNCFLLSQKFLEKEITSL